MIKCERPTFSSPPPPTSIILSGIFESLYQCQLISIQTSFFESFFFFFFYARNESFSFLHGGKLDCKLRICDWIFLNYDCTKMQSGELWAKKRHIVVFLSGPPMNCYVAVPAELFDTGPGL